MDLPEASLVPLVELAGRPRTGRAVFIFAKLRLVRKRGCPTSTSTARNAPDAPGRTVRYPLLQPPVKRRRRGSTAHRSKAPWPASPRRWARTRRAASTPTWPRCTARPSRSTPTRSTISMATTRRPPGTFPRPCSRAACPRASRRRGGTWARSRCRSPPRRPASKSCWSAWPSSSPATKNWPRARRRCQKRSGRPRARPRRKSASARRSATRPRRPRKWSIRWTAPRGVLFRYRGATEAPPTRGAPLRRRDRDSHRHRRI